MANDRSAVCHEFNKILVIHCNEYCWKHFNILPTNKHILKLNNAFKTMIYSMPSSLMHQEKKQRVQQVLSNIYITRGCILNSD